MLDLPKRLFVGRPLRSDRLGDTLLPKRLALPVFCSDPLSSVAYATEQIVLVLGLGGLALLHLTPFVAVAVVGLMVIVIASYRQTCHAYPSGGGAYAVSRANLGERASLVAASALLVDYVLTVSVSVVAGVAAVTSAVPALAAHAVGLSLGCVALLTVVNLRGTKESGRAFAVPTYAFVVSVLTLLVVAAVRLAMGQELTAESAGYAVVADHRTGGLLTVFLVLRAFASGCTALTGVEAVSNGVPSFRPPKARNAAATLVVMGALAITMFVGITVLALVTDVRMAENPENLVGLPAGQAQKTALSQIALAVLGQGLGFYLLQAATAAVLVLAANTAYNGFPTLSSLLARDGYLPRQLGRRGDRLVFSNGIVLLALVASVLIIAFDASVTRLIQLYIIGVFVSFTLSQAGMVRHWQHEKLRTHDNAARARIRRSQAVNAAGAAATGLVLLLVLVSKFTHGAYIVVIAMPALYLLMRTIARHYRSVDVELRPTPAGAVLPSRIHAIVPVSRLHEPTLRALAFARGTRPSTLEAVTVQVDREETARLQQEWDVRSLPVPLRIIDSPYREITQPLLDYVRSIRRRSPRDVVCVFVPEYVVGHWWEHLLHNQSALRLKTRLRFQPGVMITSVPWQLSSSHAAVAAEDDAAAAADGESAIMPAGAARGWDPVVGKGWAGTAGLQPPDPALPAARVWAAGIAAGAGLPLLLAALVARREELAYTVPVLLVLALIVAVSLLGGARVGVPAAVAGGLGLNWFLTPPYGTFHVEDREQVVVLLTYLAVAVAISAVVAHAARAAAQAVRARAEARTLIAVAGRTLAEQATLPGILEQIRLAFEQREVSLVEETGVGPAVVARVASTAPAEGSETERTVAAGPGATLVLRGRPLFAEDRRVLAGLAEIAATALEGRRLAVRAAEAARYEAADRARAALLAAVGHDLRTPLAGIKIAADSLLDEDITLTAPETRALLATIEDGAERLQALIDNLLDASRLHAGAVTVDLQPVGLDELINRALLSLSGGTDRVHLDVSEDLPHALTDSGLTERIVANLIQNALRYSPAGTIVTVRGSNNADHVRCDVVDHGPGLAPGAWTSATTAFQRLSDRDPSGLGLGLAVACGFAEAIGATMTPHETSGGGLTVRLSLPLSIANRTQRSSPIRSATPPRAARA